MTQERINSLGFMYVDAKTTQPNLDVKFRPCKRQEFVDFGVS